MALWLRKCSAYRETICKNLFDSARDIIRAMRTLGMDCEDPLVAVHAGEIERGPDGAAPAVLMLTGFCASR